MNHMPSPAFDTFAPHRTAALERLQRFVPRAGRDYARRRNYDLGPGEHVHVSGLSPYLRCRLITEQEVIAAVLGRHSAAAAEKFIQEVFWRTYWKGWLEMRPAVWGMYRAGLMRGFDRVQSESGLRADWEAACLGQTGIACFDAWAHELADTGYLHNHARMWFASIWIFTLRLPWELGADFFLRHLLDGDPASNTLGWRWVAGLQTPGKTYLARPDNIARYTEGRFAPRGELSASAMPVDGPANPPRGAPPEEDGFDPSVPSALLLSAEDLSPGFLFARGLDPVATGVLAPPGPAGPLQNAAHIAAFAEAAMADCTTRYADRLGPVTNGLADVPSVVEWARSSGARQVVTAYAPVGPVAETLAALTLALEAHDIRLVRPVRGYDARAWPHATHGFFRFKDRIPGLLSALETARAA